MTAFTVHADEIFDVGKPHLGSTDLQARDNLLAVLEGADGAPRLALKAIERVTGGDVVRSNYLANGSPADNYFSFIQKGSVKVTATSTTAFSLFRQRNGVPTQIGATSASIIATIDVLPFDTLVTSSNDPVTMSISTDGSNLWCGNASPSVGVTGNDV